MKKILIGLEIISGATLAGQIGLLVFILNFQGETFGFKPILVLIGLTVILMCIISLIPTHIRLKEYKLKEQDSADHSESGSDNGPDELSACGDEQEPESMH